jgi:hypothetical protein
MADALLDGSTTHGLLWGWFGVSAVVCLAFLTWKKFYYYGYGCKDAPWKIDTMMGLLWMGSSLGATNALAGLALLMRHWIFERPPAGSGQYISYAPWIIWGYNYGLLTFMALWWLVHRQVFNFTIWIAAFSSLLIVAASFVSSHRWVYFAVHLGAIFYVIHLLVCYQRRKDWPSIWLFVWLTLTWVFGASLPFLLGHAFLQAISFEVEHWWYFIGAVILGQYVPAAFMCVTVYWPLGEDAEARIAGKQKWLRGKDPVRVQPGQERFGPTVAIDNVHNI